MIVSAPDWAAWAGGSEYTLGAEEEVMLLNPSDWSLAQQVDRVLPRLPEQLAAHVSSETHRSALELGTGVHSTAGGVADELLELRRALEDQLAPLGLQAASAGTHPFTVWHETLVSSGVRSDAVYGSMRELARREPTFALHVHVGVPDAEAAIQLANRMRAHVPLLLALSVNSPFWQGRDTGLGSARTPLFQAFPRVGIPRVFDDYADWVETVDLLIRCEAFPEPTFLWWDVRVQPRFGTVEVRICDAQTTVAETAALIALVQSIARLEIEEGFASPRLVATHEVLDENRFLAARDGMEAALIDPLRERRIPVHKLLAELLDACSPHATALGCEEELRPLGSMSERTGAWRQLELGRMPDRLPGLVADLAGSFSRGRQTDFSIGTSTRLPHSVQDPS
jgi:carboxylate-amine ligase